MSPWGTGLLLVLATAMAGALGGFVTNSGKDPWYGTLRKADLTPPDIVFAFVWPILFGLMAAGALMVLVRAGSFTRASRPLGIYFTMLMVNVAWSLFFFGLHDVPLALGILAALWLLIIATMVEFAQVSKSAAWLQAPYLAWVTFAGYLNAYVWWANPDLSGG